MTPVQVLLINILVTVLLVCGFAYQQHTIREVDRAQVIELFKLESRMTSLEAADLADRETFTRANLILEDLSMRFDSILGGYENIKKKVK